MIYVKLKKGKHVIACHDSRNCFCFVDVPHAEISTEQQFYFGSTASISSNVVSCPSFEGLEWQKSIDGIDFHTIDISQPKYYRSTCNLENPILVIQTLTFEDRLHYRLLVWNIVGDKFSNTVFLNVVGGMHYCII